MACRSDSSRLQPNASISVTRREGTNLNDSAWRRWSFLAGAVLGVTAVGAFAIYRSSKPYESEAALSPYDRLCLFVDRSIGWDRLPTALGLAVLMGVRTTLRRTNLHATGPLPAVAEPKDARHLIFRTADGTYNDLAQPSMGSAGTRFGRNVPVQETYREPPDMIMTPNPRRVSLELMTRASFVPASTLNVLAAAWLQFMIRDWFSHGKSATDEPWMIPLPPGDDWYENPMRILRTSDDPTRTGDEQGLPPTYINTETHWWDASQLYGSTSEFQQLVRTGVNGKLHVGRGDLVAPDSGSLVQRPSLAGWWLGQELLFTLFTLEHNAICDRLRAEFTTWSDDTLFEHARLINAALIAKIHTVEWTTAILGHPTMQIAMRANWWGLAMERVHDLVGRISPSEIVSGIPGSTTDHYGVPYAITEEFVAVYRMHPLIPDDYTFRSVNDDTIIAEHSFAEIAGLRTAAVCEAIKMCDMLYSFGIANPGAVTLHNYPRSLQKFERPDGRVVDLASHDILRIRELGVPRYNRFRRLLHLRAPSTFDELTDNPQWVQEIRDVYNNDIESVDLMTGLYAETPPMGFGFSDTAFRIFILMASRRLNSDRFFTVDFTPEVYTPIGMSWIDENSFATILLRHHPELAPALRSVANPFAPWKRVATGG